MKNTFHGLRTFCGKIWMRNQHLILFWLQKWSGNEIIGSDKAEHCLSIETLEPEYCMLVKTVISPEPITDCSKIETWLQVVGREREISGRKYKKIIKQNKMKNKKAATES